MKKMLAGLMAVAAIAAVAQAEEVKSANAVGFIDIPIEPNQLVALSVPFVNMADGSDGSWDFKDLDLAKSAPRGTVAYFWENSAWKTMNASRTGGFTQSRMLQPGEFFFIKWPKTAEASDLIISGEVPADSTIPVVIMGKKNLSAVANPYPTPMEFREFTFAKNAPRGSQAFFWEGGAWRTVNASRNGGFADPKVVEPGEGFFFKTTSSELDDYDSKEWEVVRPYQWPNDGE